MKTVYSVLIGLATLLVASLITRLGWVEPQYTAPVIGVAVAALARILGEVLSRYGHPAPMTLEAAQKVIEQNSVANLKRGKG